MLQKSCHLQPTTGGSKKGREDSGDEEGPTEEVSWGDQRKGEEKEEIVGWNGAGNKRNRCIEDKSGQTLTVYYL